MLFATLCSTFDQLEKTSSTLAMQGILSAFFKKVPRNEIGLVCNLMEGQVASPYEGIVFGVAEKTAIKAIATAFSKDEFSVAKEAKKSGDAGLAAEAFSTTKKPALTLKGVFSSLQKISATSGEGSQEKKTTIIADLLSRTTRTEARYLTRILVGQLRLGAGTMTILNSIAIAYLGGKQHQQALEQAYNICPDIGHIAKVAAVKGLAGIIKMGVLVGRPIKMMLASRIGDIEDIKARMPLIQAEEKYDGERIQAHFDGKKLMLFSRRLDIITDQFPDIVKALQSGINAKSYIIEGECCAVDGKGNLEPFQKLMQRRRKYNVEEYTQKIPVTLFLFDLLFLNGASYINKPLSERRKALERILVRKTKTLALAQCIVSTDIEKVEEFFNDAVSRGCEGIMAKNATKDSVYQAGTRGWLWIKWKREYSKELRDTFDLVAVGAFQGKGKRSRGWGALLCASYNDRSDRYETVCKLGSGFSDEELSKLSKRLNRYTTTAKPANVSAKSEETPDVWFKPAQVLEVLGAEITRSPTHTCAEKDGKGLALRFPRFVRWRDDKKAEQATTSREIEKMAKT